MDIHKEDDPKDAGRKRRKCRKRSKTIQQSSTTDADLAASLTQDLITEILVRLPIKSILQFRCVCKSWKDLISHPMFVKKHLKLCTEDKDYAHHRLISNPVFCNSVTSCSLPSILNEESSTAQSMDFPIKSSKAEAWIIGSVNGLICVIFNEVTLFLWNPATRKSKRLPRTGFKKSPYEHNAYGVAYDEGTSDYKVVVINSDMKGSFPHTTRVKIYGLRSNSWKKIDNSPKCYVLGDLGKFVSGALHWLASFEMGSNEYQGIFAFDLSKETYSEISQPYVGESYLDSMVAVLNGCLCLCNFGGTKVEVWMMKDYGKFESWSKLFSFRFDHHREFFQYSTPLFISKRNEVLLMIGKDLVLYNMESKTVRKHDIRNFGRFPEVDSYVESLVSPFYE